jgi:hypothetical protein
MRKLLTFILIWPASQTFAQNFYLPASSTTDSSAFAKSAPALPPNAVPNVSYYFDADLNKLRDDFLKLLSDRKGKDSISLDDARQLCRTYNAYHIYAQSKSLAQALLTDLEKKTFIIDDSVLVPTRDGARLSLLIVRKKDAPEKLPVVFVFNIYTGPADQAMTKEAALHGFIGIVANTRGKRLSPQEIEPFEHDACKR